MTLLDATPDNPEPRSVTLSAMLAERSEVTVIDDWYSDRIRCDHPPIDDGFALGEILWALARRCGRGRIVVLGRSSICEGLSQHGFVTEAIMPDYYDGEHDCHVMGAWPDLKRAQPSAPMQERQVDELLRESRVSPSARGRQATTRRARADDAEGIARLITETFEHYPTPSGHPPYIAADIASGTPYRVVERDGVILSCASAALDRDARTAELTDCATRPSERGRGHMKALLVGLMSDLIAMGYPTAFSLSRANVPGINLALQRLGFELRGRMRRSCRIGTGIEDMNVWSRRLPVSSDAL